MKTRNAILSLILGLFVVSCDGPSSETDGQDTTATDSMQNMSNTEGDWKPLLDGNSKEGFTQLNGKADYKVENGVVTGTTKLGEPNSFLASNKKYSDFILEYEVKVDPSLNSGVQIRSQSFDQDTTYMVTNDKGEKVEKKVDKERVHGYQVEIDPSERAYSGGIYDEARRGWLYDLANDEAARKAFKNGEWNKFKVEAKGDSIRTWVNGVPAAKLSDAMNDTGFIAFQVHGTKEKNPLQVQWRNIRIKELTPAKK